MKYKSFIALFVLAIAAIAQDTPPTLTNYTWSNQGLHLAVQNADGNLSMSHSGAAGLGFNFGMLLAPLPVAPYTLTVGLTGMLNSKATSLSVCLVEQSSGKFIAISLPSVSDTNVVSLAAFKMNSPTSYAGAYSPTGTTSYMTIHPAMIGGLLPRYLKVIDTGTLRAILFGQTRAASFLPLSVVSNTDFISPTHYGYCMRGAGDSQGSLMTVFHESLTTP